MTTSQKEKKPGFFKKMMDRLDQSMKEKADEKANQPSCCGPNDKKGGKCC